MEGHLRASDGMNDPINNWFGIHVVIHITVNSSNITLILEGTEKIKQRLTFLKGSSWWIDLFVYENFHSGTTIRNLVAFQVSNQALISDRLIESRNEYQNIMVIQNSE